MIAAALILGMQAAAPVQSSVPPDFDAARAVGCVEGPITKEFGGSDWLVFGCSDGGLVIQGEDVSTKRWFLIFPFEGYRQFNPQPPLSSAEQAAADELAVLTPDQIRALHAEIAPPSDRTH